MDDLDVPILQAIVVDIVLEPFHQIVGFSSQAIADVELVVLFQSLKFPIRVDDRYSCGLDLLQDRFPAFGVTGVIMMTSTPWVMKSRTSAFCCASSPSASRNTSWKPLVETKKLLKLSELSMRHFDSEPLWANPTVRRPSPFLSQRFTGLSTTVGSCEDGGVAVGGGSVQAAAPITSAIPMAAIPILVIFIIASNPE